jgi:hypothetical protein
LRAKDELRPIPLFYSLNGPWARDKAGLSR